MKLAEVRCKLSILIGICTGGKRRAKSRTMTSTTRFRINLYISSTRFCSIPTPQQVWNAKCLAAGELEHASWQHLDRHGSVEDFDDPTWQLVTKVAVGVLAVG